MTSKELVKTLGKTIIRRELAKTLNIKIIGDSEKNCWFINKDWSHYATIKGVIAHRLVYSICIGPLIPGQEVCHTCDRKGCINPEHLFQGTHSDNMKDARKKGRCHWHEFKLRSQIPRRLRRLDNWKQLARFCK
jgi:hypothetical protein